MENRGRGRLRGVAVLAALAAVAATAAVCMTGSSAASSKRPRPIRSPTTGRSRSTCGLRTTRTRGPSRSSRRSRPVLEEVPERHDQAQVLRLHELHQDPQARAQQRATRPMWPRATRASAWTRARQGEADPTTRSLRREVRLGQVLPAGHGAAFPLDPDGKTFGKGNLWGVGQFGQSVGVFSTRRC